MKNVNEMMVRTGILAGLIILICISNISAFAVSSDYWGGHSLQLNPGETKEFSLTLQNLVGTSDLRVKAIVTSGSAILKLADPSNVYLIPAGEKKNVNFKAIMPIDAKPGQTYNVKIDFSEMRDSSSGEFGFGTAIGQNFDVVAMLPPEQKPTGVNKNLMFAIIIGVALIAIIILVLKKSKKRKPHKKIKSHKKRKR
jgi:LPXTG-motif cell wall-anchored protein